MKPNFVAKGATRYVMGKVERFDQKNEVLKRSISDPSLIDLGQKFFFAKRDYPGLLKRNKPGFTLLDSAFEDAGWFVEVEFGHGNAGGKRGLYSWETPNFNFTRRPTGVKLPVDDAAKMTKNVKKVATKLGAALVGVCELDRQWLYSHYYNYKHGEESWYDYKPVELPEECKYAIVVAIEMDREIIKSAPAMTGCVAAAIGYSKMAFTCGSLAQFIRDLGYKAIPSGNDTGCGIPIAIDAGLGELGRNGLLITPQFGPRVRLCKVFTDLPLVPDRPIEFGVWDFCLKCERCAERCPGRALMYGEPTQEIRNISNRTGLIRWPIDAEKCFRFWLKNGSPCFNCVRTCPFNKPSGWLHDAVKWGVKNTRWMDSLFLRAHDALGYDKRVKPGRFWE